MGGKQTHAIPFPSAVETPRPPQTAPANARELPTRGLCCRQSTRRAPAGLRGPGRPATHPRRAHATSQGRRGLLQQGTLPGRAEFLFLGRQVSGCVMLISRNNLPRVSAGRHEDNPAAAIQGRPQSAPRGNTEDSPTLRSAMCWLMQLLAQCTVQGLLNPSVLLILPIPLCPT